MLDIKGKGIWYYAECKRWDKVVALTDSDMDLNTKDEYGQTILHLASYSANKKTIGKLIERGSDVHLKEHSKTGSTPLHCAAYAGNIGAAEVLIKNFANIDAKNNYGWTPLHIAVNKQYAEMVLFLLQKNAKVDIRNQDGWEPLHLAIKSSRKTKIEIIEYLLKFGANPNSQNPEGMLLESKHDSSPFGRGPVISGRNSLELAKSKGRLDIVKLLEEYGAKLIEGNNNQKLDNSPKEDLLPGMFEKPEITIQ